jgi:CBS domain-containing protein
MAPAAGAAHIRGMRTTGASYDRVRVADAMHRGVISCRPDTSLPTVARMMSGHNVHCIVVRGEATPEEEGGTLWGVVSDLDLAAAIGFGDEATAGRVAATPAVTIDPSESLRRAAQLMAEHGIAHLVAVRRGRPVGVISTLDLARAVSDAPEERFGAV